MKDTSPIEREELERFEDMFEWTDFCGDISYVLVVKSDIYDTEDTLRNKLKTFIASEIDKAYKLGKCVGVQEESERWSEIVKMIKEKYKNI